MRIMSDSRSIARFAAHWLLVQFGDLCWQWFCDGTLVRGWPVMWDRLYVGMSEDRPAGWDFFVSYTQADRTWAEWVAWVLEEDGHKVLVQAWDFVPGSNWIQGMQAGAARAARTIAVLSPAYLESEYGTAEWQAAWASDPAGAHRKLLVTRVTDCDRPGLLAGVVGVDLFGRTEAEARARLRTWSPRRSPAGPSLRWRRYFPAGRCRASRGFPGRCRGCGRSRPVTRISPAAVRTWLRWPGPGQRVNGDGAVAARDGRRGQDAAGDRVRLCPCGGL